MKRIITLCALFCAVMAGRAGEIVLCDFEDCNVGDVFQVESIFAPGVASTDGTAVVVEDPTNPDNKVLKVSIKNWNTFVRYDLPDGITGQNLLDLYQKISFDLYRDPSQTNDYMQTAILLGGAGDGSTTLYWDSSYPFLGNRGEWVPKSYDFNSIYNESTCILLGLHCDVVEYYIDNIRLSGVSSVETDTIRWTAIVAGKIPGISVASSTGVHDWEDVIKCLLAGASAVQMCSAIYTHGAEIISQILTCVEEWIHQANYQSIAEFKGKLNYANIPDPAMYERSQFMKYFSNRD